jgi:Sec-independent protein translocase protein TatA
LALIDNLGGVELLIVFVAALLVFGKRLPEVAGQAGKHIVKLRRSFDSAWKDTGIDREIRQVQRDLDQAIPRDLSIGDMARLASEEMDKRVKANQEEARQGEAPDVASPPAESEPSREETGAESAAGTDREPSKSIDV